MATAGCLSGRFTVLYATKERSFFLTAQLKSNILNNLFASLKKSYRKVKGVIMGTRIRSFLSAAEAAQQVMKLLENGQIPLQGLHEIIMKYGHGGSIEDYWERLCPDNGNRIASLFRPCYETTGILKPEYQHVGFDLGKAFFWVNGLQRPRCVRHLAELQDELRGKTVVSFESFFHESLLQYSKSQNIEYIEQISCIQEGSPDSVMIRLDPWAAAPLAPLNAIPSADESDQPSQPNRIKRILELVMRWIVSYELAGREEDVAALSHLIDLTARQGNIPDRFSIVEGKVYPIVLIAERERSTTLRSRGSASERPPAAVQPYARSLTPL